MLNWFRYQIRNYFAFNRKETNGTIILILGMVLFLMAPFFYSLYLDNAADPIAGIDDKKMLDSLVAVIESKDSKPSIASTKAKTAKEVKSIELFNFDPNTASTSQLEQLGVTSKMAQRINNYTSKGGKFRVKKDLLKIYGFPEDLYVQLNPYILLPDTLTKPAKPEYPKRDTSSYASAFKPKVYTPETFDLNDADTTTLKSIKGIGSGFSKRIINYREKLGGFVSEEQLREVYGLEEEVATEALKYAEVEAGFKPKQININSALADEMKLHPYISPTLARLIVAYRQQHGPYKSVDEIENIKILKQEDFLKLKPYLTIE